MSGSFRTCKITGIEIDINWSWIIILVLLTVSLATGWFPQLYPGWSTPGSEMVYSGLRRAGTLLSR